jgi:hypothetical protein
MKFLHQRVNVNISHSVKFVAKLSEQKALHLEMFIICYNLFVVLFLA